MKFIFPTPVVWDGNESRYLQRDGARYAEECRRRGHEGVKIILDDGTVPEKPSSPLLECSTWEQWQDSAYWKSTKADFCLFYAGLATRFEPVAKAIRDAGIRIVLIQDSAFGLFHPSSIFSTLVCAQYYYYRDSLSPVRAFAKTWMKLLFNSIFPHTKRLKEFLSHFDGLVATNELAQENTQTWLRKNGLSRLADHTLLSPHGVRDSLAIAKNAPPKKKQILAITLNWTLPRKAGGLLADTLSAFLSSNPDYSAVIIGTASDRIAERIRRKAPSAGTRVAFLPMMDSKKLCPYYTESEILFIPSGSESGPIVAYEALCCGCSVVVAPPLIQWKTLQESQCGRIATRRTAKACCAALKEEARDWANGERNAEQISAIWSEKCHVSKIFDKLLRFKDSL